MKREVVIRGGQIIPVTPATRVLPSEKVIEKVCRFRSLGCIPCTGAIDSAASTISEIIEEMKSIRSSERAQRVIDYDSEGSMEKKREGYF